MKSGLANLERRLNRLERQRSEDPDLVNMVLRDLDDEHLIYSARQAP